MSADLALELEDVVFRYQEKGRRNILDHTSLTIPAGTLTVLMGGSGCGKSTLAAVAAGLYPENGGFLESGIIRLYGQDLKTLDPQKRAAYLTVLFQNPDLQFCMNTLREEMRFCLENICIPAGKMDERIEQAAAELGILFALSTEGDFFIASLLHQCRLPPKFAYGILAAFHLMPGMAREYAQVRTAFAVRGLKMGPLSMKPVFTMLVNSVRWSESIAMAMESKGFCGEAPRTYYTVPRVHWYDLAIAALMVGGVVLGMLFLNL